MIAVRVRTLTRLSYSGEICHESPVIEASAGDGEGAYKTPFLGTFGTFEHARA